MSTFHDDQDGVYFYCFYRSSGDGVVFNIDGREKFISMDTLSEFLYWVASQKPDGYREDGA